MDLDIIDSLTRKDAIINNNGIDMPSFNDNLIAMIDKILPWSIASSISNGNNLIKSNSNDNNNNNSADNTSNNSGDDNDNMNKFSSSSIIYGNNSQTDNDKMKSNYDNFLLLTKGNIIGEHIKIVYQYSITKVLSLNDRSRIISSLIDLIHRIGLNYSHIVADNKGNNIIIRDKNNKPSSQYESLFIYSLFELLFESTIYFSRALGGKASPDEQNLFHSIRGCPKLISALIGSLSDCHKDTQKLIMTIFSKKKRILFEYCKLGSSLQDIPILLGIIDNIFRLHFLEKRYSRRGWEKHLVIIPKAMLESLCFEDPTFATACEFIFQSKFQNICLNQWNLLQSLNKEYLRKNPNQFSSTIILLNCNEARICSNYQIDGNKDWNYSFPKVSGFGLSNGTIDFYISDTSYQYHLFSIYFRDIMKIDVKDNIFDSNDNNTKQIISTMESDATVLNSNNNYNNKSFIIEVYMSSQTIDSWLFSSSDFFQHFIDVEPQIKKHYGSDSVFCFQFLVSTFSDSDTRPFLSDSNIFQDFIRARLTKHQRKISTTTSPIHVQVKSPSTSSKNINENDSLLSTNTTKDTDEQANVKTLLSSFSRSASPSKSTASTNSSSKKLKLIVPAGNNNNNILSPSQHENIIEPNEPDTNECHTPNSTKDYIRGGRIVKRPIYLTENNNNISSDSDQNQQGQQLPNSNKKNQKQSDFDFMPNQNKPTTPVSNKQKNTEITLPTKPPQQQIDSSIETSLDGSFRLLSASSEFLEPGIPITSTIGKSYETRRSGSKTNSSNKVELKSSLKKPISAPYSSKLLPPKSSNNNELSNGKNSDSIPINQTKTTSDSAIQTKKIMEETIEKQIKTAEGSAKRRLMLQSDSPVEIEEKDMDIDNHNKNKVSSKKSHLTRLRQEINDESQMEVSPPPVNITKPITKISHDIIELPTKKRSREIINSDGEDDNKKEEVIVEDQNKKQKIAASTKSSINNNRIALQNIAKSLDEPKQTKIINNNEDNNDQENHHYEEDFINEKRNGYQPKKMQNNQPKPKYQKEIIEINNNNNENEEDENIKETKFERKNSKYVYEDPSVQLFARNTLESNKNFVENDIASWSKYRELDGSAFLQTQSFDFDDEYEYKTNKSETMIEAGRMIRYAKRSLFDAIDSLELALKHRESSRIQDLILQVREAGELVQREADQAMKDETERKKELRRALAMVDLLLSQREKMETEMDTRSKKREQESKKIRLRVEYLQHELASAIRKQQELVQSRLATFEQLSTKAADDVVNQMKDYRKQMESFQDILKKTSRMDQF